MGAPAVGVPPGRCLGREQRPAGPGGYGERVRASNDIVENSVNSAAGRWLGGGPSARTGRHVSTGAPGVAGSPSSSEGRGGGRCSEVRHEGCRRLDRWGSSIGLPRPRVPTARTAWRYRDPGSTVRSVCDAQTQVEPGCLGLLQHVVRVGGGRCHLTALTTVADVARAAPPTIRRRPTGRRRSRPGRAPVGVRRTAG